MSSCVQELSTNPGGRPVQKRYVGGCRVMAVPVQQAPNGLCCVHIIRCTKVTNHHISPSRFIRVKL